MSKKYDVFGVGNALVDTLVRVDEAFLSEKKIQKGIMTLVDAETQGTLLNALSDHHKELRSGGSAANTMIALANSGGTGCYTGKVSVDAFGEFYKKDMEEAGIYFEIPPSQDGHTGTCLVLTTPDADRTMLTHLGISTTLTRSDIDTTRLGESKILYVEGYLFDGDSTRDACIFSMQEAKRKGIKIAFTMSDPFCVNRSRQAFINIIEEYVDYVFCNHDEALAISLEKDPMSAIMFLGNIAKTSFMTWGAKGAVVNSNGGVEEIPGFPVQPIDTNGAGDAFAAGVLFGITQEYTLPKSCRWGNYVASRMILETGARLSAKLMGHQDRILTGY